MAVDYNRQYVGARYVPKIFNDGEGGMVWKSNTYYEPLTIVYYNNSSYISRVPVPAHVGNPVDNGNYWALSGVYNGMVANLQGQITSLEKYRPYSQRLLFIGDSYATGDVISGNRTSGWFIPLKNILEPLGFIVNGNPVSGSGFLNGGYSNQIKSYSGEAPNRIIVVGGANDSSITISSNSIKSFVNEAHSKFPNATIEILDVATGNGYNMERMIPARDIMEKLSEKALATFIRESFLIMHRSDYVGTDGLHPNQRGIDFLVQKLGEYVVSNKIDVSYVEEYRVVMNGVMTYTGFNFTSMPTSIGETIFTQLVKPPEIMTSGLSTYQAFTHNIARVTNNDVSREMVSGNIRLLKGNLEVSFLSGYTNITAIEWSTYTPIVLDLYHC